MQASLVLIPITFALLVFFVYSYFKRAYKYWKIKNISYLKPVFPFGNLSKVYTRQQTLGEAFGEAYLELKRRGVKHGGVYALKNPVYIPIDPEIIKHIIVNDGDNFVNHGFYLNSEDDPLSAHLFNMEGYRWKGVRANLVHAFTSAKVKNMFSTMVILSQEFQKRLDRTISKSGNGIHMNSELFTFTADVISTCGFGMDTNAMKNENQELLKHGKLFVTYQWSLFNNTMVFLLPRDILKKLKFKIFKNETTEFVRKIFGDLKRYREDHKVLRDDLLNTILNLKKNCVDSKDIAFTEPISFNECMAQMWVFFCTSMESSASTITFALYELSLNPDYQNRLREEIKTVLARHGNKMTYEAVNEMVYIDCVIQETLRKYPIFPVLPRICKEDYAVPGTDFILPKNSYVMVSNFGIHRDPEYYPNPLIFDPERFTKENKAKRPFISNMPFGEGPRICIGKRFGLLQSKVALITIIENYEVTLSDKTERGFKFAPWELVLRKIGDIWINLHKIKREEYSRLYRDKL